MIDIHCHILPGIDFDGPGDYQETLAMARMAAKDGIQTIIATPHLHEDGHSSEYIHAQVEQLNRMFRAEGISLIVLPGAEARSTLEPEILTHYTLNNSHYVLLEFSHLTAADTIATTIYEACQAGLRPIIAHAERHHNIQRNPNAISDLIASGALVQVTAESLSGRLGVEARFCGRYLLRQKMVHFLATDAHSSGHRSPILSEGLSVAANILGDVAAQCLVSHNPAAVVQGKQLNG